MMKFMPWVKERTMTKKCSVCGRMVETTINDAEEVFVFKDGRFFCGQCYLKERYKHESEQTRKSNDAD